MEKPSIKYPCEWIYTVIGTDEQLLRKVVSGIFKDNNYSLSFSKKSSGGKYISLTVKTTVSSENERNEIFSLLCKHPDVKTVL